MLIFIKTGISDVGNASAFGHLKVLYLLCRLYSV